MDILPWDISRHVEATLRVTQQGRERMEAGATTVMGRGGGMGRQSCDDKGWYSLQNQKIPAKGIVSVHEYRECSKANTVSVSESRQKFRSVLLQVALLQMYVVICRFV